MSVKAIVTVQTAIIVACCDGGFTKFVTWPGGGATAGVKARAAGSIWGQKDAVDDQCGESVSVRHQH